MVSNLNGTADGCAALETYGYECSWSSTGVAFGGATALDPEGNAAICGPVILDNLAELQSKLKLPDSNDAQVLAALFAKYGPETILHARGMFAVAAWNIAEKSLTLLRDSVGTRNIYYCVHGGSAWFSTSLQQLSRCPIATRQLSITSLRNYLTCAYVPGEDTMWEDIKEVRPGSAVELPSAVCKVIWTPAEGSQDRNEPIESTAARLRPLLEESVQVCLPTSLAEPTGIFLSGGLDSSLVTAIAARMSDKPVNTYAIHFGEEHRNELEFSSMVAKHCGTKHRIIELTGKQIRDTLYESIAALDDPIGDPLTTPNLILGRIASEDVSVILNGEGGDPCFGGPKNLPMLLHELYSDESSPGDRERAYLRAYQKCYDDLPTLFTAEAKNELRTYPPQEEMFAPYMGPESGMSVYLNRLMLMNTLLKGADNILTKVNNLTSVNGLLGRSPLFDRRIVEASFAIPPEYKQAGAVEKAILKMAVADRLPEPILTRPKSGMLVPVQGWFRKDLKRMAKSMLLGRSARIRPYIRQDVIKEWLAYKGNLWPRHGVKLWLLLTLEIWLRAQE